jgi:hypothetical protein
MRIKLIVALVGLPILLIVVGIGVYNLFCSYDLLERVESPDKRHVVLIYFANCGATTGGASDAVLRQTPCRFGFIPVCGFFDDSLVYSVDSRIFAARWLDNQTLEIACPNCKDLEQVKERSWKGITIQYVSAPVNQVLKEGR